ncbi:YxeA family protein [Aminipila terrae]|uniref:YxeA family protein n=1 Tax=Aminipila terrae TaxID=2697030 RepID=A0A6P1MJ61_9FIRM|nr:YxeA family protein [Aminipila terrae]QHI71646.1 YxeA family protein [Aminipila terrae]
MKKFLLVIGVIILVISAYFIMSFDSDKLDPDNPSGKTVYYTTINNDKVELNGDNRYEYKLSCYDEKGKEKSLDFTTGKELKAGAYVKLFHATFRGVTHWEEVKQSDLPERVQKIYKNNK